MAAHENNLNDNEFKTLQEIINIARSHISCLGKRTPEVTDANSSNKIQKLDDQDDSEKLTEQTEAELLGLAGEVLEGITKHL